MWDNETTFSNRQILADSTSEHTVDTGGADPGPGEPVHLQVVLTPGCAGPLAVSVDTDDSAGMENAIRAVQYIIPAAVAAKGGTALAAPLPTGCRRFLRLSYAGGGNGYVTAGLVQGSQTNGMARGQGRAP